MGQIAEGDKEMSKSHDVEEISFGDDSLLLKVDGREYRFKLSDISERLAHAPRAEREKYEISPSGYGIHWPMIDEDLSIDGLLGIKHAPSKQKDKLIE